MTARPAVNRRSSLLRDTSTSSQPVYLTVAGRRLLEERIRLLEATVGELRDALEDPEHSAETVEGHQRAAQELARVHAVLRDAHTVEDVPDDPRTVELGDTVTIQVDSGSTETYIVVHSAEAPTDDRRISVDAPLGAALIDRHVGDEVEVPVPGGAYRCTILTAARDRARS